MCTWGLPSFLSCSAQSAHIPTETKLSCTYLLTISVLHSLESSFGSFTSISLASCALLWARYDKYEWKKDKEGTLYITPSPDAKMSLYNPLNDSEQMVLKAVNLGLHHLSFGIFTEKSFHQRGKYEHRKISFLLLSL